MTSIVERTDLKLPLKYGCHVGDREGGGGEDDETTERTIFVAGKSPIVPPREITVIRSDSSSDVPIYSTLADPYIAISTTRDSRDDGESVDRKPLLPLAAKGRLTFSFEGVVSLASSLVSTAETGHTESTVSGSSEEESACLSEGGDSVSYLETEQSSVKVDTVGETEPALFFTLVEGAVSQWDTKTETISEKTLSYIDDPTHEACTDVALVARPADTVATEDSLASGSTHGKNESWTAHWNLWSQCAGYEQHLSILECQSNI